MSEAFRLAGTVLKLENIDETESFYRLPDADEILGYVLSRCRWLK